MVRREKQRIAVRVHELAGDPAPRVEILDGLLPAADQVAAEGLVPKPLHRHRALAPQPDPARRRTTSAACEGRQSGRGCSTAQEREPAVAIDDSARGVRRALPALRDPLDLMDLARLAREQVAQRQARFPGSTSVTSQTESQAARWAVQPRALRGATGFELLFARDSHSSHGGPLDPVVVERTRGPRSG